MAKPAGLGVIWLTVFIDLIGFSILFPLFAHLVHYYGQEGLLARLMVLTGELLPGGGTPNQQAALFGGILLGLYSVLQWIFAPLWGRLSDRIGRRRVLILTVAGTLIGYLLWIVADSFEMLVFSRLLCGVMAGNISVATAAVGDITTPNDRTKGMGTIGMAFGLGFILGPAIGSVSAIGLEITAPPSGGLAWNPFSVAACIAAGLALINLLWVCFSFGETLPVERRQAKDAAPLTLDRGVRHLCNANLLFIIVFAAMEATLVFLAHDLLAYSASQMGWIFAVLGLTSAVVQGGVVRRLAPRFGPKRLAIFGLVAMIPAFLLIGAVHFAQREILMWLGIVCLGVGVGFTMPSLSAMVSLLTGSSQQGRALGSFRGKGALGRAIGPFLGAGLYFWLGPSGPYFAGAALLLAPILMIVGLEVLIEGPETRTRKGADDA